MKKVLGLDLGTNSVGFALVQFSDDENQGQIIQMGARIVPKDPNFHGLFEKGALGADSKNAQRRTKRGIRRGYQRWQGRRNKLLNFLKQHQMLPDDLNSVFPDLTKEDKALPLIAPAYRLYELRAKAATEKISLKELGRVMLMLNNKRGFKSNRKAVSADEKETDYKKQLNDLEAATHDVTIGQYLFNLLKENPYTRLKGKTFYRKKYIEEFDTIWMTQKQFYPDILTGEPGKKDYSSLYSILKNDILFYQRPLKSAKGLVGKCRYEPQLACTPVSSPLFQHFRIWKSLNDIRIIRESGEEERLSHQQKLKIYEALHTAKDWDKNRNLTAKSKVLKKILEFKGDKEKLNFDSIPGNKTYLSIQDALQKAGVNHPENLRFTRENEEHKPAAEKTGLNALWHLSYSIEEEETLVKALLKNNRFGMTEAQAKIYAQAIAFPQDFSSLSAKAIRTLIPHMENGYDEYEATVEVGYRHSDSETKQEIAEKKLLPSVALVKPNELRNPVVEQILNQAIQVVNAISEKHGKPDEVRIELARNLRATADQRSNMTKRIREQEALNKEFEKEIAAIKGTASITARDRERLKLWKETKMRCLYSGKTINQSDVFNGRTEIEHILPRSLFADNSLQNKILVFKEFNEQKKQRTAWDYIQQDKPRDPESYKKEVMELLKNPKTDRSGQGISKLKRDYLLMAQENIPTDFTNAQLKATEYITKEITKRLKSSIRQVTLTSGAVTAILRDDWGLNEILRDINLPRYAQAGKVVQEDRFNAHKNEKYTVTKIEDWSKRDDHRHHALDALVVALTTQGVIQRINTLNAVNGTVYSGNKKQRFPNPPVGNIHAQVKDHLNNMLLSFKKSSKAVTLKKSKAKRKDGTKFNIQTLVPRGSLHEDTIFGKIRRIARMPMPIAKAFHQVENIAEPVVQQLVRLRIEEQNGDILKAIKQLKQSPLEKKGKPIEFVKVFEEVYTKRVDITALSQPQVEKILDAGIKAKVKERIGSDINPQAIKAAFENYEQNPLYLDDKKTIVIRKISVEDNGDLTQVRSDKTGQAQGYAYLKNNHHALVHETPDGNWTFRTVSLWEATARAKEKLPVIDKSSTPELKFVMSMQNNDLFFRTPEGEEIPEKDWFFQRENLNKINQNLFRVQKMSTAGKSCDIVFRHQFETNLKDETPIRGLAWERIQSNNKLKSWIKIHLDKTGQIIRVGE